MSWIFHRHSRSKSKSSLASTSGASPAPSPSTPSSHPASAAATITTPSSTVNLASPSTSKLTDTVRATTPPSIAPFAASSPPTSLDELRTLIADFEADVNPSDGRRIIRKVYEGATDAALGSLDVLSLVPVVSAYVPVIRSVLLIGLLARTGRSVRDACRELATRISRLYELLGKVQGAKADELGELYKEILEAACKLNSDHRISSRGGGLGDLRLGIESSLLEEIQGLHVKLDRLHMDFTPHVLLGLVNKVDSHLFASSRPPTSNLGLLQPPPPAPVLIGREQWLDMTLQPFQSPGGGHVVLSGTGGIGKSSLALSALHSPELGLRFDRKLFIRCDTTPSAEALVEELVRVRGQPLGFTEEPIGAMVRALEQLSTLLVLDNMETPLDADGGNTKDLIERLASIATVSLLITTRNPSLSRQPLPRPLLTLIIPELGPQSAKELFLSIAPDFEKDRDLNRLLHILDGYPLAICLVASRAQDEDSIAEVLKLWQDELEEFDRAGRTRKDSLAISLSLSFSSTPFASQPKAQQLLALLAALPRSLSHSRIHALGLTAGEKALIHTSLVKQSRQGSRHSVRLLAPVREYVRRSKDVKLAELSLATKRLVVESFLEDFGRLPRGGASETMNPSYREGTVPLDFASNAVVALEFAFSLPSTADEDLALKKRVEATVLRLCLRMGYQRRYVGTADDAMRLFEGLKTTSKVTTSPLLRLALLLHQALLSPAGSDPFGLAVLLQQGLDMIEEAELESVAATSLRAEVYFSFGHLAEREESRLDEPTGNPLLQAALALATEVDDLELGAWIHYALAIHSYDLPDEHSTLALKIAEEQDLLVLGANMRVSMALREEEITLRKKLLQEAVDLFLQLSDLRSLRECYYALGLVIRANSNSAQDLQAAAECFARCELLFPTSVGHAPGGYIGALPYYSTSGVRWTDRSWPTPRASPSNPRDGYSYSPYRPSPYASFTPRSAYSVERGELSPFSQGVLKATMSFGRFRALNAFQLYQTQLSLEALTFERSRHTSGGLRPSDEAYSKALGLFESSGSTDWCSFLEAHRLRFSDSAHQLELLKQESQPLAPPSATDPVLEAYKTYEIISNPFFPDSWSDEEEKVTFLARAAAIVKLDGIHRDFDLERKLRWATDRAGQTHLSGSSPPSPLLSARYYGMPPPPPHTVAGAAFPRRHQPPPPPSTALPDEDLPPLPRLGRVPSFDLNGRAPSTLNRHSGARGSRFGTTWNGTTLGDGGERLKLQTDEIREEFERREAYEIREQFERREAYRARLRERQGL